MAPQHRYLLALPRGEGRVFLSWRLLDSDRPDAPFFVERRSNGSWARVGPRPVVDSTNALDVVPGGGQVKYRITTHDGSTSEVVRVDAGAPPSLLALDRPPRSRRPGAGARRGRLAQRRPARLRHPGRTRRHRPLQRLLARRQAALGARHPPARPPARGGWDGSMHHVPFLCWDINADGRTEFVCHDFMGAYPKADYDTAIPGELLTDWQRKNFVPVHWDEGPEVVFAIRKENKRIVRLLPSGEMQDLPDGKLPEGGVYGRNLACVDVVGDYRENIITVDTERHRLMVLANPAVAHSRGRSPWGDFEYRHDRSQLGSGYYIYLSPPDTRV